MIEIHELKKRLVDSGIDLSLWGQGEAKTVENLSSEINDGEVELVSTPNGKLTRKVAVANIDVTYINSAGQHYRLIERRQVLTDGRERMRTLETSVAEKLKAGEDVLSAAKRGVEEELGISNAILESRGTEQKLLDSPSYPGLISQYEVHKFSTSLSNEQYKPEGYVEKQADKSTYFEWEASSKAV